MQTRYGDPACPPNRLLCVGELLTAWGDQSLQAMADRLRCGVCARPVERVAMVRATPAGRIIQPMRGGALL
ncbi:hypothetical protein [Teichococcus aerofrigidensis]